MTTKNLINPLSNAILFNLLAKITGIFKFSFILGSSVAFFSTVAMVSPLAGAFAGIAGSVAALVIGISIRMMITGGMPFFALAYHVPGFFASLHWATNSQLVKVIPSLLCMILFLSNPIGAQAALYSMFWLIPLAIALFAPHNLFTRSLASTFTAHAVGSVIWLYTVPMTADAWLMLIPVVMVERLFFALGMVVAYKVILFVLNALPVFSNRHAHVE